MMERGSHNVFGLRAGRRAISKAENSYRTYPNVSVVPAMARPQKWKYEQKYLKNV